MIKFNINSMPSPQELLAVNMIANSVPDRTIEFFFRVYPLLEAGVKPNCRQMGNAYGCTPQAASKHVRKLVAFNYLQRVHYRAWELSPSITKELEKG